MCVSTLCNRPNKRKPPKNPRLDTTTDKEKSSWLASWLYRICCDKRNEFRDGNCRRIEAEKDSFAQSDSKIHQLWYLFLRGYRYRYRSCPFPTSSPIEKLPENPLPMQVEREEEEEEEVVKKEGTKDAQIARHRYR